MKKSMILRHVPEKYRHKHRPGFLIRALTVFCLTGAFLSASPAFAQFGTDDALPVCAGGLAGNLRGVAADNTMSYCDGASWIDIGVPGGDGAGNPDPVWLHSNENWISVGKTDAVFSGQYIVSIDSNGAYLSIVDISTSDAPVMAGSVQDKDILRRATAVAVDGNYAYITTNGNYDLVVVDISDKNAPTIVANVLHNTGQISGPNDITVTSDTVVITSSGASGIYLFDVTDPTSPVSGARLNTPGAIISNSGAIESNGGTHVFFKGNSPNFVALEISDVNAPVITDFISIAGVSTAGLVINATHAFLTSDGDDTIHAIDISDPSDIAVVDSLALPMNGVPFPGLANNHLFYGNFSGSFYAVDVLDPANMFLAGEYTGNPRAFRSRTLSLDKLSYNLADSLLMMNTADVTAPFFLDAFELSETCGGPFDGFFYCMEDERFITTVREMTVWDYNDPVNPVKRGTLDITFPAASTTFNDIDYEDGYVYMTASNRLFIIDVSDRDNPAQTYSGAVLSGARIDVRGDRLYAANGQNLVVADVTDKASPAVLSTTNVNLSGSDGFDGIAISADRNFAYLGSEDGDKMAIVDISNEDTPEVRSNMPFANVGRNPNPAVKDNIVYFMAREGSASSNYVTAIDVTDPVNPVAIDEISKGSAFVEDLFIYGDYLLANTNFEIFDISTPANMTLEYTLTDVPFTQGTIGAEGSYGFIANTGIHVFDLGTNFGAGGGGVAAICTEPQAAFASLHYDYTRHVLQVCNGSGWSDLGPVGPGGAGCTSPDGKPGSFHFDRGGSNTYEYCDGANWVTFN
jgi:hypothetical protein